MAQLLDYDPVTRTRQLFHWNESDESFVIETKQDVEQLVEYTKGRYNLFDERSPWKGDLHLVASIPPVVWEDLMRKGIANDEKALRKWLDDKDNAVFRTRPGRVSK